MAQESQGITEAKQAPVPTVAARPASNKARAAKTLLVDAKLNLAGEDRQRLIAEAAYFRAERRGFQPGCELEDWLAAEIEIDALLDDDEGRA
ncbi:MAG: DUF2934 domain-containing protein [Gammaproteobacteria bacterium]|jgi:hypothetical protein|nr:DUF2934 domain-containing protein [Gammaproteobacteria bacterium]